MKIILPIIVLLIIIIFIIIILNRNIYFSEDFEGSYNQNTIEDVIPSSYIPFNPYLTEQISEYDVINIYKMILDRSPNPDELKTKVLLTKIDLSEELYNSYEYEKMIKIQNNMAINDIENTIAKENLTKKILKIYKDTYSKDPEEKFISPLRDCYIHLANNIYLFIAFIQSKNFPDFEKDILATIHLTKESILISFNKFFNLLELKLVAEDKIRSTRGNISLSSQVSDVNYDKLKTELNKIIDENKIDSNLSSSNNLLSIQFSSNSSNLDVSSIRSFLSNQIIEPFYDYKSLLYEGFTDNVYNTTTVGYIYK
jgi:hypothetical protein